MTQIVIDKKKYILLSEKEYEALQLKIALKTKPSKLLTLKQGLANSKKLVRKWTTEK